MTALPRKLSLEIVKCHKGNNSSLSDWNEDSFGQIVEKDETNNISENELNPTVIRGVIASTAWQILIQGYTCILMNWLISIIHIIEKLFKYKYIN
jgi:hypothetical protein